MNSAFENLRLASGRTVAQVRAPNGKLVYPIEAYKGKYLIQMDRRTWSVIYIDEESRQLVTVAEDLESLEAARMAQFNHNLKRIKKLIQEGRLIDDYM